MDEVKPSTGLGAKLRALRLGMGLSILAAAKASGMSKTHIWNLENRDVNYSRETLSKLAWVYGVDPISLIDEGSSTEVEEARMVALYRDLKELSERDLATVEMLVQQFKSK